MSEFRKAFYMHCPIHEEIEHPKWRKCPKCEEVITYSEEEVYYFAFMLWEGFLHETKEYPDYFTWFETNKKK